MRATFNRKILFENLLKKRGHRMETRRNPTATSVKSIKEPLIEFLSCNFTKIFA